MSQKSNVLQRATLFVTQTIMVWTVCEAYDGKKVNSVFSSFTLNAFLNSMVQSFGVFNHPCNYVLSLLIDITRYKVSQNFWE